MPPLGAPEPPPLPPPESLFIHFGGSRPSNVFFTRRPNNVKKFSSSGSGSRGGGPLDILVLLPNVLDDDAGIDVDALDAPIPAEGLLGLAQRGLLVTSLDPLGEARGLPVLRRPSVEPPAGPSRSRAIRSRPSRHPPVPKPDGLFSSSSSSRMPKPKIVLIRP